MKRPFDKRGIEVEMLDRRNLFSIDKYDVKRLDEGIKKSYPTQRRCSITKKLHNTFSNLTPRVGVNAKRTTIAANLLVPVMQDKDESSSSSCLSERSNISEELLETRKAQRKKISDAQFIQKSQYNHTLRSLAPPDG